MKSLLFNSIFYLHKMWEYLFDRWEYSIEEYPEFNKMVIWKTNKFSGKIYKRCKIKELK